MADYAINFTPRYVIQYTSASAIHTQQVRVARGTVRDDEAVTSKLAAVATALAPGLPVGFAYQSGTYYPEDGFVGSPIDLGDLASVVGTSPIAPSATMKALQLRFEGRGSEGGRVSLSFFGTIFADLDGDPILRDFRINPGENAPVSAAITALSELAPVFVAMGSVFTIWKSYANLKFNDAWVRKARAGI